MPYIVRYVGAALVICRIEHHTNVCVPLKRKNSLDAGIQDSSTSISIMYKIEEMSHEEEEEGNGDESDKHI